MKKITISLLVILLAASGLLMGCVLGDNPFPYISGSVTVADERDWPDLRTGRILRLHGLLHCGL